MGTTRFELQDDVQALQDPENYNFEHERDFSTDNPHDYLEGDPYPFVDRARS